MHVSTARALPERKHVNTQAREYVIHANTQNTWVHQARDLADWRKSVCIEFVDIKIVSTSVTNCDKYREAELCN